MLRSYSWPIAEGHAGRKRSAEPPPPWHEKARGRTSGRTAPERDSEKDSERDSEKDSEKDGHGDEDEDEGHEAHEHDHEAQSPLLRKELLRSSDMATEWVVVLSDEAAATRRAMVVRLADADAKVKSRPRPPVSRGRVGGEGGHGRGNVRGKREGRNLLAPPPSLALPSRRARSVVERGRCSDPRGREQHRLGVLQAVHEARDAGFAAEAAEALALMHRTSAATGSDVGRRELPAAERAVKLARGKAKGKHALIEHAKALAAALPTEALEVGRATLTPDSGE